MSFKPSVLARCQPGVKLNLVKDIGSGIGMWSPPHEFTVVKFESSGVVLADSENRRLTITGSTINSHFEIKESS